MALCLLVQGTVVQTHIHFPRLAEASTAASAGQVRASLPGRDDPAPDCPLCREAATAGAYLLPSAPVLPPPPTLVLRTTAMALAEFRLLVPVLGWLSRAPPE